MPPAGCRPGAPKRGIPLRPAALQSTPGHPTPERPVSQPSDAAPIRGPPEAAVPAHPERHLPVPHGTPAGDSFGAGPFPSETAWQGRIKGLDRNHSTGTDRVLRSAGENPKDLR